MISNNIIFEIRLLSHLFHLISSHSLHKVLLDYDKVMKGVSIWMIIMRII